MGEWADPGRHAGRQALGWRLLHISMRVGGTNYEIEGREGQE